MIRTIHRSKYVLAEADLLLQNAAIHISDPGRICRIEPWHSPPANLELKIVDWGSAVILPGLVNAHTQLELTRLHGQMGELRSFTDWLSRLVQKRRDWTDEQYLGSARDGAALAVASGTTLLGDASASGMSWHSLKRERLRKVVFEETLALDPEKSADAVRALESRLERVQTDALLTSGVSPHAPYSTSPELYREVAALARRRGIRLATHVAETKEELRLLAGGTGELKDFLVGIGALQENWIPPATSPVGYLETLGVLDDPTVMIHCNYLDAASIARILDSRSSVVYCPRSHAFFGHEPHPVRQLLDSGVNVALGTDSLASNNSLSMLDEIRFLFNARKDLKCEEIIRMATLNGASALGLGGVLGRLRRGYWADITVLELPENVSARNLIGQILEGAGECAATIVRGEIVWEKPPTSDLKPPTSDIRFQSWGLSHLNGSAV